MNTILTKVGLGVALAATSLTVAAPAEAQRYRHYDRHRGSDAGTAIVAGIAGLAIGAAIASSNNDRYRDNRYYDDRGYDGYYYDRGPRYDRYPRYTYRPRYNYRQQCRTQRVWDGYARRYVRVRHCR